MTRKTIGVSKKWMVKSIRDAHKNPKVMSEIRKFVRMTTEVYMLSDYNLK